MKNHIVRAAVLISASTLALLAGCGGGSSTGTQPVVTPEVAPTVQVPETASLSVVGFISYLNSLVAVAADSLESVDVGAVNAPSQDTSEPSTVI